MARQIRRQHHAGVAAVQNTDLLLLIRMVVRHELHRQPRLLGGKLQAQGLASLDDPQAEGLSGVQQSILIAVFSVEPGSLSGRISGDDAIHQRIAKMVLLPEPVQEILLQCPVGGVVQHGVPQDGAVVGNEFTGQENQPRFSGVPALPQQPGQLGGEGGGRAVVKATGGIVDDACLRGVGNHEPQFIAAHKIQQLPPLGEHVQCSADAPDEPSLIDYLTVEPSPQIQLIQPVLPVDAPRLAGGGWRDDHHAAVKVRLFVHLIDEIIHKASQEVAVPKLQDTLRHSPGQGRLGA